MLAERTVVFVDILGFSAIVMASQPGADALDGFRYADTPKPELRESLLGQHPEDPLTRTFAAFHRLLDIQVNKFMNGDPLQSVVFSDSAFVAFRDANCATWFAQALMRDLVSFHVPARMGIGQGTFRALRLTTDISDEVWRHTSQFLGTGVIRAHRAESCGLKGLRIFIHPDSQVTPDWPGGLCRVAEDETDQNCDPPVTYELNYLQHHNDLQPTPGGTPTPDAAHRTIVDDVKLMSDTAPAKASIHYEKTLLALERMRIAYAIDADTDSFRGSEIPA